MALTASPSITMQNGHAVEIVSELPKTRNAKVLRRVVRSVYLGTDPGDLSSLENQSAIEAIGQVRPAG